MLEVYISKHHVESTNLDDIQKIIEIIVGNEMEYDLIERDNYGRYLEFEYKGLSHFVAYSNNSIQNGRNSYIVQFLPPAINAFINSQYENKQFHIYFTQNSGSGIRTPYHIETNKMMKTLGFNILNESIVFAKISQPYNNFDEFYSTKFIQRGYNSSNNSTYFFDSNDHVALYGKLFGANGMESVILALVCKKLVGNKPVVYYPVLDNGAKRVTLPLKYILDNYDVKIDNRLYNITMANTTPELLDNEIRDQATFKYNLIQKFGIKKCYLCDCEIDKAIVAAHIHRIADIKTDTIGLNEKVRQAVDGNNGFWLCRNHDILFEHGLIYFDNKELTISTYLQESDIEFINNISNKYTIEEEHFTNEMREYLEKHKTRVN